MNDLRGQHPIRPPRNDADDRLDSWKEIAAYLERTVTTVKRWEKEEGLPVLRHVHNKQATVYASRSEIDTWLENRGGVLGNDRPGWFRFFSENKKIVAGGVTLLLLVGLVAWMDIGSSPNPEGLSFQQRDWVLIADFENRTGEAVFDGVLEYALEREISNSQFVNVVPRERIEDTLRLMRKPLDTRIDRTLGREICLRDGGIKALLTGRVEKLDSTYLLSVELVDPSAGQTIAATSKEAAGQGEVLETLRFLSRWSRETLGEKLTDLQASEEQLESVTTPSLRALQLFTEADALISQGRSDLAEMLLEQAVDIDPEFPSAHIFLALAVRKQRKPADEFLPYAERAFQLAHTTGDRERYFIQGTYYWMKGETDQAIHAYETLLSLCPDHFWAFSNLAALYRDTGQDREALDYALRRADLRPNSFIYPRQAAFQLLRRGDLTRAMPYVQRTVDLITLADLDVETGANFEIMWFLPFEALLRADPETALGEASRSLEMLRRRSFKGGRVDYSPMGALYLTLGKIERAREWFEKTTEPGAQRQVFLAAIAYVEEDHKAMTEHLEQVLKAGDSRRRMRGSVVREPNTRPWVEDLLSGDGPDLPLGPTFQLLLARGGLLSEADRNALTDPGRPDFPDQTRLRTRIREKVEKRHGVLRGVLAVSQDNRIEGLRMLGDALSSLSLTNSYPNLTSTYFMGSEILAEAWREQGDSTNAVTVLRAALEKESFLLLDQSVLTGPLWLRLQAQLAQLYRDMGHHEDARKIEDKLRRILALADAEHPILLQLDRAEDLASVEPAKN